MTASFSLVDERWIPCMDRNGHRADQTLREALCRAREFREVHDDSPLVTVAVYRLLLAILHRVIGPPDEQAWLALWADEQFDPVRINEYLDAPQCHFDLFDGNRPFYQAPGGTDKPLPATAMSLETASGSAVALYDHTTDEPRRPLTCAEVARSLLALQAFSTPASNASSWVHEGVACARKGMHGAPLAGRMAIVIEGDNLFQTLLCNLPAYPHPLYPARTPDPPAWEGEWRGPGGRPERAAGPVELYTWQSRLVRLLPYSMKDAGWCVTDMYRTEGRHLDISRTNLADLEPMAWWRKNQSSAPTARPWVSPRLEEERALWRDSATLLGLGSDEGRPPACVSWLQRLSHWHGFPADVGYRIMALGVRTDEGKGKVDFWRQERLPVPLGYLKDSELVGELAGALGRAETSGQYLRQACWKLGDRFLPQTPSKERKKDIERLLKALAPERPYWAGLEEPFRRLLSGLPEDAEAAREDWHQEVQRQYWRAFWAAASSLGTTERAIRAVARTEGDAWARLREVFPKEVSHEASD